MNTVIDKPVQPDTCSDSFFHSLINQVKDGYLLIDPINNNVLNANQAAIDLLGYSLREFQSLTVTSLFGHDIPALITFTECVLLEQESWTNELACKMKNGRLREVEIFANTINADTKSLVMFQLRDKHKYLALHTDATAHAYVRSGLTEWKRVEQIFQDIERENQLMLHAVGEGIYGVNADGKTTFINPAGEELLGWKATELVGKDIHSIIHYNRANGEHYPSHDCPIYTAFKDGEVHQVDDDVFWHKDGHAIHVEYTSTPVEDNGILVGAVVVFRDVSERRHAEENLRKALHEVEELKHRLEMENAYLQEEIKQEHSYTEIVGNSAAVKRCLSQIDLVAKTDTSVLITGESGTGKELLARGIHENSLRKERPLIRVNCAAIPRELFESEFFGHIKGAFTGAISDRTGRFELADGGTLFLDEVGEIPLELQSKLLRVIQDGQFERVGDTRTREVDVRIIAATNRDLAGEVKTGRFRADLYFRLNVFPIEPIPLRERIEDIPILASHFLQRFEKKLSKSGLRLSHANIETLQAYHWPGNIRELENVMERAVILSRNGRIFFELPNIQHIAGNQSSQISNSNKNIETDKTEEIIKPLSKLDNDKQLLIEKALARCKGKVFGPDGAAALLKIPPTTLSSKIKRLGIDRNKFKK